MALRRSTRLSSLPNGKIPPLQPSIQAKRTTKTQPSNGITKARKPGPKSKKGSNLDLEQTLADPAKTFPAPATKTTSQQTENVFDPPPPTIDYNLNRLRPSTPPLDRPVEPHRTNATLLTPHGSSVVAYPPGTEDASPSKTGRPRPTATTGTLLEQAVAHLIATDPRLEPLIQQHPCQLFSPEGLAEQVDPFEHLVSSIIGQQVSGAAASSIKNKFIALFRKDDEESSEGVLRSKKFPTPDEVVKIDLATLRTGGLSQRKAEYIHGLSQKFASGELSARKLLNASDEELMETLIAVRGLGQWTVEMFACFALKRIDVFSLGDLGV
ncbi:3-methyladenine DNA glycosylase, partial [Aspergillus nanangensis]